MNKEDRNRYLLKNTTIFAVGNFASKMISFFLVPLYTNVFNTSQYGVVDLVNIFSIVLVPIITLNISEAIMRFSLDNDANQIRIMSVGITVLAIGSAVGLAIIPFSSLFSILSEFSNLIYLYIIVSGFCTVFLYYLRGKELLVQFATGNIINSLTLCGLNILLLVKMNMGIKGYLLSSIISHTITTIYTIIVGDIISVIRQFYFDMSLAISMIRYSSVLIPNSLMWWIMNSSDRIMVTSMVGIDANGIYSISYKIPSLLNVLSGIFNQAWSYSAIHENDSKDIETYSNSVFSNMVKFLVVLCMFLLAVIKTFMHFYVEASFSSAWKYTPYLFCGMFFLTLGTFLATQYTVNKDSKGYLFSATAGAVINIILNLLFIPVWGISGAALATCISYIIVFAYRVTDTKKYITINVFSRELIPGYILLILSSIIRLFDVRFVEIFLVGLFIIALYLYREVFEKLFAGIRSRFL